jgi:hypothetical protein
MLKKSQEKTRDRASLKERIVTLMNDAQKLSLKTQFSDLSIAPCCFLLKRKKLDSLFLSAESPVLVNG